MGPEEAGHAAVDPLLQAALGSMPYGFSVWNLEQQLVLYNRRYLEVYGFPHERVRVGMTLRDMSRLTWELGNYPGYDPDEVYLELCQRLRAATDPDRPVRGQRSLRDRVIKTTHTARAGFGWIVTHEDVTAEAQRIAEAKAREIELCEQNLRFTAAVDSMGHGLSMYDANWNVVICNQRYCDLYGLAADSCRPGTPFTAIMALREQSGAVPVDLDERMAKRFSDTVTAGTDVITTHKLRNGRVVRVTRSMVAAGGFVAVHEDITDEISRLEQDDVTRAELNLQHMRLAAAVDTIDQGLCMFDGDERLVICNAAYARVYNLPAELMKPGTSLVDILGFRFAHGMEPVDGRDVYIGDRRRLIADRQRAREIVELKDGRAIALNHHPTSDGGWVAVHEDVTEQRQNESRIRHLARHDALTGLPNRLYFREEMAKLEQRILRSEIVAVLCVDLDRFKAVNDTLGHAVGDAVLIEVAARLNAACRETDMVARLGGDEFAVLVCDLQGPADASVVADRIVRTLAEPFVVEGRQAMIGASVGIAVAPTDGTESDTLLKNADLALYRAKSEGRGAYHFFERGMDQALQRRRSLEQGLRLGLARGEFRLLYQPLVNLADNRITGLEALLRWDHPDQGLVPPAEFVPIAEETGVIVAIGEWALREACRAAAGWPNGVHIAVNLSPIQFKNRGLVGHVANALRDSGLDPGRLELEITESLLLADTELTLATLRRLRALGVRIAMDDFGTGYSSLSYLRSFPFDKIKIDRSFMRTSTGDDMAIIEAVIGLGRSLGMSTTAEGIETEAQLDAVRANGCTEAQGFLLSPPLPGSSIPALLGIVPVEERLSA